MEQLYTIKEIAEYLKVKVDTVNKWIQKGKLKSYKVAGTVRVTETDLKEFVSKER